VEAVTVSASIPAGFARAAVWIVAGLMVLPPVQAAGATKQSGESPLLVKIDQAHCLAMYDLVELRLKGRGAEVVSNVTRNGLKDFFVVRPGVVDCSGQREIPWTDDKDREFIHSVLKAAGEASKPKLDMSKEYGIAPAPRPTRPRR
jgi:hypothetical protein